MDDKISNSLNVTPLTQNVTTEVTRVNKTTTDFEYARGNLINIIEKGNEALDGILDVANMSQHPRSYEVVATLIKTMSDANKDLLDLSKKQQDLQGDTNSPQTINNNLFVGSTAELQKFLKNQNGEK